MLRLDPAFIWILYQLTGANDERSGLDVFYDKNVFDKELNMFSFTHLYMTTFELIRVSTINDSNLVERFCVLSSKNVSHLK